MAKKSKTIYVCENCGQRESKWLGRCPQCGEWNTFEEEVVVSAQSKAVRSSGNPFTIRPLTEVEISTKSRLESGSEEFDMVLGGGFVSGQVVLFSGEPGIGKSTLLLQTAVFASQKQPALYISAEESELQVATRASRLFEEESYADLQFTATSNVQAIVEEIQSRKYKLLVLDSIQTVYNPDLASLPGSLSQIKACSAALIEAAKQNDVILILVGHINKEGNIAGPKVLEHLVDTVLQLEGERSGEYRLLRSLKNRFGPTGEVGLLLMTESGLVDMQEMGSILSATTEPAIGTAKTISIEGNRSILIEVQALTNETVFAYPKRVAEGISVSRLQLICAILDRFAGAKLGSKDVYVRTAGGYNLKSPIADLAIAAAILSSLKKKPLAASTLFVGELSLSGKLFMSDNHAAKLKSMAKYGVKKIAMPQTKSKNLPKLQIQEIEKLTNLVTN